MDCFTISKVLFGFSTSGFNTTGVQPSLCFTFTTTLIGDLQAEVVHVHLEGAAVDLVRGDLVVHRHLEDAKTHTRLGERVLDEEILALVIAFKYDNAS